MDEKREFTFQECGDAGLRFWQCPPFLFSVIAIAQLGILFYVASIYVFDIVMTIVVMLVFLVLVVLAGMGVVHWYKKFFKKNFGDKV